MRITIHASSSPSQKGQIRQLEDRNMLGSDVNIIHANAITESEIRAVTKSGASITMTPYSEMRIGYGLPRVNELHQANVNLSLGVDTTALTGNADLFSIMKMILNLGNARAGDEFYFDSREVIRMATISAARTLGIDGITGSLTPGKRGDLILLRKNDINFSSGARAKDLLVEAAQPGNVELVSVDGRILKKDGVLTGINVKETIERAEAVFQQMHSNITNAN